MKETNNSWLVSKIVSYWARCDGSSKVHHMSNGCKIISQEVWV